MITFKIFLIKTWLYCSQGRQTWGLLRICCENYSLHGELPFSLSLCHSLENWRRKRSDNKNMQDFLAGWTHAIFHVISLVVFFFKIYFTVTKELAGYFQSAAALLLWIYASLKSESRVQLFGVTRCMHNKAFSLKNKHFLSSSPSFIKEGQIF